MSNIKHIYLVPRWGGNGASDWYPWLKKQLEASSSEDECTYQVHLLDMPSWDLPVIGQAVDYLSKVLPPARLFTEEVYLVGHSVGCLAILHYLARVAEEQPAAKVGGVLCVAGWFMVDSPWEDILNWMNAPIDFDKACLPIPADKLTVLLSDDDPYTSGYKQNKALWVDRLRANVTILASRQHFSSQLDPDVRDAIRDLAGAFAVPARAAS